MKKIVSSLLVVVLVFSFVACAKKEEPKKEEKKVEKKVEKKEKPKKVEKKKAPKKETKPKLQTHQIFKKYPLVIMLDNHWDARPQSGISKAKVIYEMLAEGRITRIMMITDANEGVVGPIRSARPYYIRAMKEYEGLYCHVGGSGAAKKIVKKHGIKDMDQFWVGGDAYWREDHRWAPHNMYSNFKDLYKVAKKSKYKIKLDKDFKFPFDAYDKFTELKGGKASNSVQFNYTSSDYHPKYQFDITYKYNKKKNIYEKYYGETKLIDEATKKPLEVSNVIIQVAKHSIHRDGKHRVIKTVGEGKGYYLTGGKYKKITWKKKSKYAPTQFLIDGKQIVVNPGLTFINVVETDMEVTFE